MTGSQMKEIPRAIAHDCSAVRLFGSKARGDADDLSDADILIVKRSENSVKCQGSLLAALQHHFGMPPSVGWYSEARLSRMYKEGDLFAWHIHKESKKVNIPRQSRGL